MVPDILHVFPELLQGFQLTMTSSSWMCWISEHLPSPRNCAGYPWTNWVSLSNNFESWKTNALSELVHSQKGCLVLYMPKRDSGFFMESATSPQILIWVGPSSNQTQNQGIPWWCSTMLFRFSPFRCYDWYNCSVYATYEFIFLEYPNKLVIEPIDSILIPPCLEGFNLDGWQ